MVKRQRKHSAKRGMNQGKNGGPEQAAKISQNTRYEYCSERLSPFGGRQTDTDERMSFRSSRGKNTVEGLQRAVMRGERRAKYQKNADEAGKLRFCAGFRRNL